MDPRDLGITLNAYFLLSKHTKQLLLVTYCDPPAGIEVSFWTHRRTDGGGTQVVVEGKTHVEVEIVI